MDEHFKYPPGIRTAQEWSRGESFVIPEIEAIQQDAVSAARREVEASYRAIYSLPDSEKLAANNAAHKDKICKCVSTPWYQQTTYEYGGVRICSYCGRPIL